VMDLTKRGGNGSRSCKYAGKKEKEAEGGGMRRGMIQLKPSRASGFRLGITQHPSDNPQALFVQQPSAAKSCKKMGR